MNRQFSDEEVDELLAAARAGLGELKEIFQELNTRLIAVTPTEVSLQGIDITEKNIQEFEHRRDEQKGEGRD